MDSVNPSSPETKGYQTILADPPWPQNLMGQRKRKRDPHIAKSLPYPTLPLSQIAELPVGNLAAPGCHLWLWTTNQFLRHGFDVMEAWGFKYLAPITWVKPSGCGNYFVHRTQTLLFGYKQSCRLNTRYQPNVVFAGNGNHSQKPLAIYDLVEKVSFSPRLELFARKQRIGWDVWGNEVESSISLSGINQHEH